MAAFTRYRAFGKFGPMTARRTKPPDAGAANSLRLVYQVAKLVEALQRDFPKAVNESGTLEPVVLRILHE